MKIIGSWTRIFRLIAYSLIAFLLLVVVAQKTSNNSIDSFPAAFSKIGSAFADFFEYTSNSSNKPSAKITTPSRNNNNPVIETSSFWHNLGVGIGEFFSRLAVLVGTFIGILILSPTNLFLFVIIILLFLILAKVDIFISRKEDKDKP